MVPFLLPYIGIAAAFPAHVWYLLLATGLCQAIYYCGLAGAYRSGHLSVAYPLARSIPVVLVTAINMNGHHFGAWTLTGMLLIVAGGIILPVRRWSVWTLRHYLHVASLFALMAAVGTAGYSIVDDAALRVLRSCPDVHANRIIVTMVYALLEGISSTAWMAGILLVGRRMMEDTQKTPRPKLGNALLAGIGIYLAYSLVLLAMTFARNVSYIVAFRQLSIPIGALLGITVLREPHNTAKMLGIATMVVGLVLVAMN